MAQAVTESRFAGLQLAADPEEAGAYAIDLLNVDFDHDGRVRTRNGYADFATSPAPLEGVVNAGIGAQFVGIGETKIYVGTENTLATGSSVLATYPRRLANFGAPTGTFVYAPVGTSNVKLTKWDGTTLSYPTVNYSAYYAGVTPWDNRLVLASEYGPTANPHRVRFSDAGLPETYSANNYVDLHPGDGEEILGICEYQNQLFVFKKSRFYVFYGTSTDSTGNPVFNYRTVEGAGIHNEAVAPGMLCCATTSGVYFVGADGVYRTTGGFPQKVSSQIDPLFRANSTAYSTIAEDWNHNMSLVRSMCEFQGRLYLVAGNYDNGTTTGFLLVFDPNTSNWTYWDINAQSAFVFRNDVFQSAPTSLIINMRTSGDLKRMGEAYTTDDGAAIVSKYRTGFLDFGSPGAEKRIRNLLLVGTGTPTVKLARNDAVTLETGSTVTLGTSPAVSEGYLNAGGLGRNFSIEVSSTSGAWSLSSLSATVANVRNTGLRSA
jgi:hypothetical protein